MHHKIIFSLIAALITNTAFGQSQELTPTNILNENMTMFFMVLVMVIALLVVLLLAHWLIMMSEDLKNELLKAKGVKIEEETEDAISSFFNNLENQLSDAVPVEEEASITMDHDYDGIRELDNNLPPWWKYMFYATIVWAVAYFSYFHIFGEGELMIEAYESEMAQAAIDKEAYLKKTASLVDENSVKELTNAASLEKGKKIFLSFCVACHGATGEGGVGPNFTDQYWIHGGSIKNIFKTIKYGVPEKGMISWEAQLSPVKMQEVASYILTFQGTNPPNGKAPEGELWVEKATADSN